MDPTPRLAAALRALGISPMLYGDPLLSRDQRTHFRDQVALELRRGRGELPGLSYPAIAREIGDRSHVTAMNRVARAEAAGYSPAALPR